MNLWAPVGIHISRSNGSCLILFQSKQIKAFVDTDTDCILLRKSVSPLYRASSIKRFKTPIKKGKKLEPKTLTETDRPPLLPVDPGGYPITDSQQCERNTTPRGQCRKSHPHRIREVSSEGTGRHRLQKQNKTKTYPVLSIEWYRKGL